jgi:eukaryotic-like serine/threonine-protein kinase
MTPHDADAGALREHYRELTELGRGAEGFRYSATLPDEAPVVVLAIHRQIAEKIQPERFLAALENAARVHHEALPRPLSFGCGAHGLLHCAYPRFEQVPLAPGNVAPADVAHIGMQLSRALNTAHNAGLVHGAISTERITQTRANGTQLHDFGLFSALNEGGLTVTEAATLLSDPAFVSPETQLGQAPDARSDVFSLGASLYELLTGKPPYGGRTTSYVMATVLSDSNEQPGGDAGSKDLTGPIVDALLRAIERAPEDRWPTAQAFASALAMAAAGTKTSATESRRADGWLGRFKRLFS